ncbi:MAG: small basic family protein [Clostridia bacterium]|nr:small basic family protein [Clostridia bacterium]
MLIIIAIILGGVLAFAMDWYVPPEYTSYVAIVVLAFLDTIFGGFRAYLEKRFNTVMFATGLVGNSVIAVFLMFIGKRLELDLHLAAVIVFGSRLFLNFASIRRILIDKFIGSRKKKHEDEPTGEEDGEEISENPEKN